MTAILRTTVLSCLLAGLAPLPAQTANDSKVIELDKVEVNAVADPFATQSSTGTKTSTPLAETPQSISVITRDEMDLRNVKNVAEALRYSAGVSIDTYGQDPRGYDWVNIRGFDAFNGKYLDGLPLFNYELLQSFGLQQIDVLKGPSSVLYGQSTPGGLINTVSKRPTDKAFGEISGELGTHQAYEGTFDVGGPITLGGTLLYRVSAQFTDIAHDTHGYDVGASRQYLAPAFTWHISDVTTLTILSSYFHGESTQIPSIVADPNGHNTGVYINNPNFDYEENTIYRAGYEFEHHITPDFIFRQNTRASRYDTEDKFLSALGYTTYPILDRYAELLNSSARSFVIDNQAELKLTGERLDQTLLFGANFAFSSYENHAYDDYAAPGLDVTAPDYSQPIPYPGKALLDYDVYQRSTQEGLYAQDQLKFDTRWIVTLSARYDWAQNDARDRLAATHAKQTDQALSGRAGLLYAAANGLSPYVNYATSFYPNSGTDAAGNSFDPTEGKQIEAGLKYAPKGVRGLATISVFQITQSNVLNDDPANPGFSKQTAEIRSRGIEFESKFGLTPSLDLLLSATYDDVDITKNTDPTVVGNTPALTSEKSASAWLDYTFHDGSLRGLTLGAGVRYVGPSYAEDANLVTNHAFTVTDLAVRYARGSWIYSLNADNVFNKTQEIYDGFGGFDQSAGRSLSARVTYHW